MWIGNLMLLVLNLPLVGLWVTLLTIPYRFLFPAILVFCSIGVFSLKNSTFEVYEAALFGLFVGAIPGLTATMATALLVPVTFFMPPVPAVAAIVTATAMAIF
jgi:TctA family transporter